MNSNVCVYGAARRGGGAVRVVQNEVDSSAIIICTEQRAVQERCGEIWHMREEINNRTYLNICVQLNLILKEVIVQCPCPSRKSLKNFKYNIKICFKKFTCTRTYNLFSNTKVLYINEQEIRIGLGFV